MIVANCVEAACIAAIPLADLAGALPLWLIGRMVAWGGLPFGAVIGGLVAGHWNPSAAHGLAAVLLVVAMTHVVRSLPRPAAAGNRVGADA